MKKLFVTLLTSVFAVLTGQAQVFTVDGLTYVITNAQAKTVSVTYFNGKGTDGNAGYTGPVVIPQNVTNEDVTYEVTGIGISAFAYSEITSVTIPASVTSVGNTAFYGSHLTSITIADSDQPLEWPNGFYDGPMREISDSYSVYLGRDLSYSDTGRSPFVNAKSVTFGQNVTTINKCMFYDAKNLTDVVISNGVTTIGEEAFRNAGSNEDVAEMKVTMGENVTEIGPAAFYNATHLKALTLPTGLKVVSNEVLAYTAVNSVTIPAAVDSISRIPFYGSPITSIRIDDSQKAVKCENGFYDWMMRGVDTTYTAYIGRDLIYDDTGRSPFVNAKSATFGADVTTINKRMFYDAKNLTDVVISNGVTTIGEEAFRNAGSNEDVAEMKVTMGENVTEIGPAAFYNATHLKALTLPTGLKVVSNEVLAYTAVNSVTIPAAVDSISRIPFYGSPITSIRIEDSQNAVKCVNGFYDWMMLHVDTTYTVYIGRDLIYDDTGRSPFVNAKSVTFSENITEINPRMFYEASKLASVTIGSGVKTIGEEAFRGAGTNEDVEEMTVKMGENVTGIGPAAFYNATHLKALALPAGLKVVSDNVLGNTAVSSVTIPAAVDSISRVPFYGSPITSLRIEDSENAVKCLNGFYDWMMRGVDTTYTVYMGRDLDYTDTGRSPFVNAKSVTFGENVTTINNQMFDGATKLESVVMSDGVTTVGAQAFQNTGTSEDVEELTVTMGKNVTAIGEQAFKGAKNLKALTLPAGLKVVSHSILESTAVNSVTIPAAVDSIGANPFWGAPVTSIRFEDSQKAVKCINGFYEWMMRGVDTTYDVYVGRDFVSNDESRSPFINAKSVSFGPYATTVNKCMFYDAQKVESVTIGDGMKTIGAEAFRNNGRADGIEEMTVVMGKNVTEIGDYAFLGAKNLKSITLPAGLKVVCHSILEGTAISAVTIPAAVDSIGANPFYGAPITSIRIEDNEKPVKCINGLYDWMMRGVETEYSVYMGRDIDYTDTSRSPFANATSVTFGKNVTTLKANQLNTSKLMTVNAPWRTPIPIVVSAFNNTTYQNATLWIPGGTKPAYQEADGWKNFMHVETSSYVVSIESTKGGSLAVGELSVSNGEKAETTIEGASEVTFVVTPAEGYELASLTLNSAPVTVTANNTYTIPSLMEDVALVATFTPIVYQIVYNLEGGVAQNPATYTIESETFTLTNPTREHYIFTGWTGTGLEEATLAVTIEKGSMGNREYKATWTPVEYTISYDLDGGVLPQEYPTVYTIEHDDITLVNPTKEHYDFIGWTGTGLGETPVKTVVIAKGSFGNREYKANWEAKTYIVTIQGNGATADNYTPKYGERVVLTLMDDPEATLVSLTVNGVDVTSEVVNNQYIIERVEGDIFVEVVFRSIYEYIQMAADMTTFSCPQDLNFTGSDLKAYIAAGFNKQDNEVLLVRVYDVPAGTGLVLKGKGEQLYKVPYAESQSYYVNLLKAQLTAGMVEPTTDDKSNFLLSRDEFDEYKFYAPESATMLNGQKAYLQVPTSFLSADARIVKIAFAEDETQGLERFEMFGNDGEGAVYNLAGQRVKKTGHGLYIQNGKVIINKK